MSNTTAAARLAQESIELAQHLAKVYNDACNHVDAVQSLLTETAFGTEPLPSAEKRIIEIVEEANAAAADFLQFAEMFERYNSIKDDFTELDSEEQDTVINAIRNDLEDRASTVGLFGAATL